MPEPVMIHWGPYYYAQRPDGELYRTDPSMVGSSPVAHTFYIFGIPDGGTKVMVNYMGEGPYDPSGPIATEARFQLFGAATVEVAPEADSAGGVTIVKEP